MRVKSFLCGAWNANTTAWPAFTMLILCQLTAALQLGASITDRSHTYTEQQTQLILLSELLLVQHVKVPSIKML